jgi:hypothetical protein
VVRNQCVEKEEEIASLPLQQIEPKIEPRKTDWGNLCKTTTGTSQWDNDDEDEDLTDLMDLLNARDQSLNEKISHSAPPLPPPPATASGTITTTTPEPSLSSFHSLFGPIWLQEEYESTFVGSERSRLDHEEDLLRKYLDDLTSDQSPGEEDSSILSLLRSQQQVSLNGNCKEGM